MDIYNPELLTQSANDRSDIYLDDISVDFLLYKGEPGPNSKPADIALLWSEGYPLTDTMKKALAAILVNKISIAINLSRVKEAELILKSELEKVKGNPAECAKLLITMIRLNEKMYPDEARYYYIKAKKLISGHENLLDVHTRNSWSLLKRSRDFRSNPYVLRARALESIDNKQYTEAEEIYNEMIELDFELPGTLCHLARVQLLSGQEKEAEKSVRKAWSLRSKASRYVVPRIIFFKILFLMIRNRNFSFWISRIEEELQNPESFMEWHIQPVLDSVKPRLIPENHLVLAALAESLQYKKT